MKVARCRALIHVFGIAVHPDEISKNENIPCRDLISSPMKVSVRRLSLSYKNIQFRTSVRISLHLLCKPKE